MVSILSACSSVLGDNDESAQTVGMDLLKLGHLKLRRIWARIGGVVCGTMPGRNVEWQAKSFVIDTERAVRQFGPLGIRR